MLAAGAGRRVGMPKALIRNADGPGWLRRAACALLDGGCRSTHVVLGACEGRASSVIPEVTFSVFPERALGSERPSRTDSTT